MCNLLKTFLAFRGLLHEISVPLRLIHLLADEEAKMIKNYRFFGLSADVHCDGGLTKAMVCEISRKPALVRAFGSIAPESLFAGIGAMTGSLAYRLLDYLTIESLTEMSEPRGIEFQETLNLYLRNPQPNSDERHGYNEQSKEKKAEDYTGGCDQSEGKNRCGWLGEGNFRIRRHDADNGHYTRLGRNGTGSICRFCRTTKIGGGEETRVGTGGGSATSYKAHYYAEHPKSGGYRQHTGIHIQPRRT